jgi:hypothetical protein
VGGLFLCDLDFSVGAVSNLKAQNEHFEPTDPIIHGPVSKMFRRSKYELAGLTEPRSALLIHHRAAFWLISVTESPVTLPPILEGAHMAWFLNKSPTLYERLTEEKKRLEIQLDLVGPGFARNKLQEKLRQLDVAAHINEWLSSPGLRAPV